MKRIISILVLLGATSGAFACPLCKDSVPNAEGDTGPLKTNYTSNGENISGGINKSIYLMFAGLFGVLGMITTVVFKSIRYTAPVSAPPPPARGGFPVKTKDPAGDGVTSTQSS
jgi:hypothetical protein